jgi:hypothetical protein
MSLPDVFALVGKWRVLCEGLEDGRMGKGHITYQPERTAPVVGALWQEEVSRHVRDVKPALPLRNKPKRSEDSEQSFGGTGTERKVPCRLIGG